MATSLGWQQPKNGTDLGSPPRTLLRILVVLMLAAEQLELTLSLNMRPPLVRQRCPLQHQLMRRLLEFLLDVAQLSCTNKAIALALPMKLN